MSRSEGRAGVSRLEERYRTVLRLLPTDYRTRWEEEMVAAFLESMDSDDPDEAEFVRDYGRPSWSEVGSVAALAVRLRLGGAGTPRSVTWGAAVRLAVLMALLTNAVTGMVGAGMRLWLAGELAWLPDPPVAWVDGTPSGFWYVASDLSGLVWLLAYLAFLRGHRGAGRAFAGLAMVPGVTFAALSTMGIGSRLPAAGVTPWAILLVDVALLVGTAAFRQGDPPVRSGPWLWALPVGTAAVGAFWVAGGQVEILLDLPGLEAVLVVGAALVYLGGAALRLVRPAPAWSLALLVLVVAVFAFRLVTLLDYFVLTPQPAWLAAAAVEAVALAAVGAPLAVLAVRGLPSRIPA